MDILRKNRRKRLLDCTVLFKLIMFFLINILKAQNGWKQLCCTIWVFEIYVLQCVDVKNVLNKYFFYITNRDSFIKFIDTFYLFHSFLRFHVRLKTWSSKPNLSSTFQHIFFYRNSESPTGWLG